MRAGAGLGTGIAAGALLAAYLLARFGFGRLYYLGALLPAFMLTLLLIAWILHLRADGWFGGPGAPPAAPGPDPARPAGPEPSRAFPVLTREVLPRRTRADPPGPEAGEVTRALLWSAAELAVLSVALYHLAGIGASLGR